MKGAIFLKFQCLFNHHFIRAENYIYIQSEEKRELFKENGRSFYFKKCKCKFCGKIFKVKIGVIHWFTILRNECVENAKWLEK